MASLRDFWKAEADKLRDVSHLGVENVPTPQKVAAYNQGKILVSSEFEKPAGVAVRSIFLNAPDGERFYRILTAQGTYDVLMCTFYQNNEQFFKKQDKYGFLGGSELLGFTAGVFNNVQELNGYVHNVFTKVEPNIDKKAADSFSMGKKIILLSISMHGLNILGNLLETEIKIKKEILANEEEKKKAIHAFAGIVHSLSHEAVAHGINKIIGVEKTAKEEHKIYNGAALSTSPFESVILESRVKTPAKLALEQLIFSTKRYFYLT